jgi:hypothetical protein
VLLSNCGGVVVVAYVEPAVIRFDNAPRFLDTVIFF